MTAICIGSSLTKMVSGGDASSFYASVHGARSVHTHRMPPFASPRHIASLSAASHNGGFPRDGTAPRSQDFSKFWQI